MRPVHEQARMTRERVTERDRYTAYLASDAWIERRTQWLAFACATTGPVRCPACGRVLSDADADLHHRTYERLGQEQHEDLVALCRVCHDLLHRTINGSPNWRKTARPVATDQIIAALHRAHQERS
jgi:5-methylcytosine-specific restriction endonuclease McrA